MSVVVAVVIARFGIVVGGGGVVMVTGRHRINVIEWYVVAEVGRSVVVKGKEVVVSNLAVLLIING